MQVVGWEEHCTERVTYIYCVTISIKIMNHYSKTCNCYALMQHLKFQLFRNISILLFIILKDKIGKHKRTPRETVRLSIILS